MQTGIPDRFKLAQILDYVSLSLRHNPDVCKRKPHQQYDNDNNEYQSNCHVNTSDFR